MNQKRLIAISLVVASVASLTSSKCLVGDSPGLVGDHSGSTMEAGSIVEVADVVVDFASQVDVPARQSGPVSLLNVKQNDFVSAQTVLAELDSSSLIIRRRAALLRQESARLASQDDVEVRYAETALAEAQAELADSQATHDRISGAVALNQLRRMRLAVERAQLEISRVEKQQRQLEIDQQLRSAELAMIDEELSQLKCVSPIDGVVLSVHRERGEWVSAGEPLVSIASMGQLKLHALVDARVLDPAQCVGLSVSVHWTDQDSPAQNSRQGTASGGSLRGKVVSVDSTRLPGNRFRLNAEVTNRRKLESQLPFRPTAPRPTAQAPTADAANDEPTSRSQLSAAWQLVPGMDVTLRIHRSPAEVAWRQSRIQSSVR